MADDSTTERWVPRVSSGAAVITTLCCLGVSAMISLATAVGATFLTRDETLEPLLGITVAITVIGSAFTFRRHRNPWPLVLTIAAGALIYGALYSGLGQAEAATGHGDSHGGHGDHGGSGGTALVWLGLFVLIGAQVWDVLRLRSLRRDRAAAG